DAQCRRRQKQESRQRRPHSQEARSTILRRELSERASGRAWTIPARRWQQRAFSRDEPTRNSGEERNGSDRCPVQAPLGRVRRPDSRRLKAHRYNQAACLTSLPSTNNSPTSGKAPPKSSVNPSCARNSKNRARLASPSG